MRGHAKDTARLVPEEACIERYRAAHDTYQSSGKAEVLTRYISVVRSKVINFHSLRSIIMAGLKTKVSKTAVYEYKIDTGCDGNLMQLKWFFQAP